MRTVLKIKTELFYGYEVHHMFNQEQYTDLFEDTDQFWLESGEIDHQFRHFPYEHFIMKESPLEDFEPHMIEVLPTFEFSFVKYLIKSIYNLFDYEEYPEDEQTLFEFSPFATFIHNIFSYAWDTRLQGFSRYLAAIAFFIVPSTSISPDALSSDNPRNILNQAFAPLYTLSSITTAADLFGSPFHMGPLQYDYPLKTIFNKGMEIPLLIDEIGFLDRLRLFNSKLLLDIDKSAFDFPLVLESLIPTSNSAFNQTLPFQKNFYLRRADLPVPYYYLGAKLREYDQFLELYTHRGQSYIGDKLDQWDADQRLGYVIFQHVPHISFLDFEEDSNYDFTWKRNTWALHIKFFFERRKIHPYPQVPDIKAARLMRERKRKEEQEEFIALATQLGENPYDESISSNSPYRYILEENPTLGTLFASDDPTEEHRYYKLHMSNFDMGSLHTVKLSKPRIRGRKRGRPKKEISVEDVPAIKRSRGRPRKIVPATDVPVIKRSRGRPRKDGLPPIPASDVSVVKRPRGRPKKIKPQEEVKLIVSGIELPYEDILSPIQ